MFKVIVRAMIALIAALMAAPVLATGALAASGTADGAAAIPELSPGALTEINLEWRAVAYAFTPEAGSVYDIYLFPADEGEVTASVELWHGDVQLAAGEGDMLLISQRLAAEETYTIRISGSGRVRLEVARHALSRCYDMPMELRADSDDYSKFIARAGDVHWYSVTAESELPIVLAGVTGEGGLHLSAQLFDDAGRLLAEATQTVGGAFLMDFHPQAQRTYYIRVSAGDGQTGLYNLMLRRSANGLLPDTLTLNRREITLEGRSTATLTAQISPAGASDVLFWESSDNTVVQVTQDGQLTGRRAGIAVVTAYGAGGVSARCRVEVKRVRVTGVDLIAEQINMNVGDDTALECFVLPENASDVRLSFEISQEGVVEIDKAGVLRATGEGSVRVTVRTSDGGFEDSVEVVVGPAVKRYRALLIGEQNYASTVAAVRPGSANSVSNIRSMLGELSYDGAKFQVETRLDASRDAVIAAIRSTFSSATAQDLSLFYITCHGYYEDGVTCFQMFDGSILTSAELERELRRIPGEIVVMIDCCGSGGAIGEASGTEDLLDGIVSVFSGNVGGAAFSGSKYKVLASAALEQDSYRISFNEEATETDMATVFARALCEATGWTIENMSRSAMRADVNYDGVVTLNELFTYIERRVRWYLDLTVSPSTQTNVYVQNVQVYPEGDTSAIFAR